VHGLFLVSGGAGLLWQLTWVRTLGSVLGTTVLSAAVVSGVFVAALGLGALWAGRAVDRGRFEPLRAYGRAELAIALLGVGGALLLQHSGHWLATLGGYSRGPGGWLEPSALSLLLRVVVASVFVAPAALLMGATLSFLVSREVEDRVEWSGFRIGLLYGINTLGAALGALATDAWLVPEVGLFRTQLSAALANVIAGVGALLWARRLTPAEKFPAVALEFRPEPSESRIAVSLLLGGMAALGFEILWLRFLGSALGAYRMVFAMLLSTHLSGLWLGATLAALLARRYGACRPWLAVAQAAAAVLSVAALSSWDPKELVAAQLTLRPLLASAPEARARLGELRMELGFVASVVFVPSLAMGMAFPLANGVAQRAGRVGRTVGQLYLATAVGNLTGALVTGIFLLPALGIERTAALLAVVFLAASASVAGNRAQLLAPALGAVLVAAVFATTPAEQLLWSAFPAGRVDHRRLLAVREGVEHTIVVTGSRQGPARLWTSGHPMTSTDPHARRYMRLMAHLPLLQMEAPRRALVICFGVGNTTRAASLHPLERLEVADLDRDVLELGPLFAHANGHVLRDRRLQVIVDDGRHWLAQASGADYDLITLEPPPIASAGVAALYSREFYALAASRLRPGGALSQWLPAYQVPAAQVRALIAAFVAVFPEAELHVGDGRELILLGWKGPAPDFSLEAVGRRLGERPAVAADLRAHGVADAEELALGFAADAARLRQVAGATTPVSDDRPTLEHSRVSRVMETRLPYALMAPERIARFCSQCPERPLLMEALALAGRVYRSPDYQRYSNLVSPRATPGWGLDLDGPSQRLLLRWASLRWLMGYEVQ